MVVKIMEKIVTKFTPQWYTIPELAEIIPSNLYHKEKENGQKENAGMKNLHVLAHTEIYADTCGEKENKIILRITADDYYKVYVNGVFAGQGPAPAYPETYYYNQWDITDLIKPGKNLIAVHAYYQGLVNRVWNSGDGRFGLAADVVTVKKQQEAVESLAWKYRICRAYSGKVIGYNTQFLEDFDSRLWDENWNLLQTDTHGQWEDMVTARWANYHLCLQPTKMLEVYEISPPIFEKKENGIWFLDTGQEIAGSVVLKAKGKSGQKIHIFCGEELDKDGNVRYEMRCNCDYHEVWTLDDGICQLEPYDYKGFRYCSIHVEKGAELLEAKVRIRHYPLKESLCTLQTDDVVLKQIFGLCKNTIKYGIQEAYLDCPTREKGQYLGDAVISAKAQVWLSGSTELLRKCIAQFAKTAAICPGLMAVAPGSLMQEIADFSLLWGELLLTDYQFTHDKDYLAAYYPTARAIIEYFRKYQKENGLLYRVEEKWNLVDWPENLRDGYDFELSRPVVAAGYHNVINALYVGAVKILTKLEKILGYPPACDWAKVQKAYIQMFYRPEKKLFVDSEKSNHAAVHSNIYPLYFGLVPEEALENIVHFLEKRGLCCGVMLSYFLLKGLARAGYYEEMYKLLVNKSKYGWVNMLEEGATTCFETWGKDQKWNTSLCHPWATAPISLIIEDLGGICLDETEEKGYRENPHLPPQIKEFHLNISWAKRNGLHENQK